MIQVYKKQEKNAQNPSGILEIHDISELTNPILLCLSAQDNFDKSIYGLIREGAEAARVYTTEEMAAGFKIDELPIDFLGLRFKSDDQYKRNYEEIVDKLIYPFLTNNEKLSVEELKKRARKINFMTYCDGTLTYVNIEKRLAQKLHDDNISDEEITSILSQITLVAIGTMIDTGTLKGTTVTFVDLNDSEIATYKKPLYEQKLNSQNKQSMYGYLTNKNNILYVYKGTGNHQVKEYLKDGNIVKPALCSVLSEFLENSIENENNDELIPVSTSTITKTLYTYSDETKDPQELLNNLDMNLSYNNTPRYTPEESQIRHELDIAYRNLQKTQELLARTEKYKKDSDDKVQSLINNIQIYSSETTFYQICVSAKVWQAPAGINPFDEPSDKQIREKYTQSLNPQTTNLDNNNQNENRPGPKRK